jgi:hypothetical protein
VKPTQHADRRRQILITDSDEFTMTLKKWRDKGESFRPRRVDRPVQPQ